jgi:hypothetical protein
MRLIVTAAVAALALAFAGTAADAKKGGAKRYTFNVSCPALAPVPMKMGTCTAAGKSKEDARATCQTKHFMCYASDPAKKKGKKAAKKKAAKKKA